MIGTRPTGIYHMHCTQKFPNQSFADSMQQTHTNVNCYRDWRCNCKLHDGDQRIERILFYGVYILLYI